jgi:hypothetical protein
MLTQLLTLLLASLAVVSVGRPWMKTLGVGAALGAVASLTLVLIGDLVP